VTTTSPGHGQIAAGGLKLTLSGMLNGVKTNLTVANSVPWTADISGTAVTLAGDIDFVTTNASQQPVNVKATVNVTAPQSTPQQVACSNATATQRLFGFEERVNWKSSNAALSFIDTPITEGCGALAVFGQGFMTIDSEKFATSTVTSAAALSVDLYVPSNQPNSYWFGAVQMYLTCPSGGVNNQYIGQVGLTGLPTAAFSTLRIPVPAVTTSTLKSNLSDCSLRIALNINQTNQSWILDNLRFTP